MTGLRISELADSAGVSTSTLRYYERIGLVPAPDRTPSGYRAYTSEAQARLLFITRSKRMGLSLDEIAELMIVWDGVNCGATKERLTSLLQDKRAELRGQIRELRSFEKQLGEVQARIAGAATPDTCDPDLGCCAPDLSGPPTGRRVPLRQRDCPDEVPIACTLSAGERPDREAALVALFEGAVGSERTERTLRVRFRTCAGLTQQLETLTAQESQCCAFLSFEVRQGDDELIWEITAPSDEAAVMIDEFASLLPVDRGDEQPRGAAQP